MTGWPEIKEGFANLAHEYAQGRAELRRHMPPVLQAKSITRAYDSELARFQRTYTRAKAQYRDPHVNIADREAAFDAMSKAREDVDALHMSYRRAECVSSSVKALSLSVDPRKVGRGLSRVWLGVTTCIAAAVSPSTQCMTVGIGVVRAFTDACFVY